MGGVIVLGAGLAGLGCASHLPGCRVFEAAARPGGHARSHELGGVCFDQGAHICHSKDEPFLARIQAAAGDVHAIAPSIVRNWRQGRWLTYPVQNHLHELPVEERVPALTDLVEAHVNGGPEAMDYRAWCLRQYGRHLTEHFYEIFTRKYWRVAPEDLATDWLGRRLLPSMLPRVVRGAFGPAEESQAVFNRFRYPARGGFFQFFEGLYAGLDVTCNERAVEIDARRRRIVFASGRRQDFEQLVLTIPLPDLVHLVKDAPAELLDLADRLRCTQLLCVNLIVRRPALTNCHWFYVYDADVDIARVSVPSNLAPGSTPPDCTALQAEVFRRDDEPMEIAVIVERAVGQLGRILGFQRNEVAHLGHVHVRRAYVISDHQRARATEALLGWLDERDIQSIGLYGRWKYVWSDAAFRQGQETALALCAGRGRRAAG